MRRSLILVLFTALFLVATAGAQTGEPVGEFVGIRLGDDLAAVKDRLKGHPYFDFRGDRDVSFLPKRPETVIDCEGTFHIRRALFQFHEERLYIMTLYLDTSKVDYYSLFTSLSNKYGPPASLDPAGAVWETKDLRLALEKPLSVKYIDRAVFERIRTAGKTEKSVEEISREKFLGLF